MNNVGIARPKHQNRECENYFHTQLPLHPAQGIKPHLFQMLATP